MLASKPSQVTVMDIPASSVTHEMKITSQNPLVGSNRPCVKADIDNDSLCTDTAVGGSNPAVEIKVEDSKCCEMAYPNILTNLASREMKIKPLNQEVGFKRESSCNTSLVNYSSHVVNFEYGDDALAKIKVADSKISCLPYKHTELKHSGISTNLVPYEIKSKSLNPVVILKRLPLSETGLDIKSFEAYTNSVEATRDRKYIKDDSHNYNLKHPSGEADIESNSFCIDAFAGTEASVTETSVTNSKISPLAYKDSNVAYSKISSNLVPYEMKNKSLNPEVVLKRVTYKTNLENETFKVGTSVGAEVPVSNIELTDTKNTTLAYKHVEIKYSAISANVVPYERKLKSLNPVVLLKRLSFPKASLKPNSSATQKISVETNESINNRRSEGHNIHSRNTRRLGEKTEDTSFYSIIAIPSSVSQSTLSLNNNLESSDGWDNTESEIISHTRITSDSNEHHDSSFIVDQEAENSSSEVDLRDRSYSDRKKSFKSRSKVKRYMQSSLDKREFSSPIWKNRLDSNRARKIIQRKSRSMQPLMCEPCEMSFSSMASLKQHLLTHPGVKTYLCELCGKSFCLKEYLRIHLSTHSNIKPYTCGRCGKSFGSKSNLKLHIECHTAIKSYICQHCGKSFARKCYLNNHILRHTATKEYECESCGKSFAFRYNLDEHLLIHTGIKKQSCHYCGKLFSHKSSLKTHLHIHTGIKAYRCESCGKSFGRKCSLILHVLTHTGVKAYTCDVCSKSFGYRSVLNRHMITHTGLRPYACDNCGKSFADKGDLSRHLKTHTAMKSYACNYCEMSFSQKIYMKKHSVTHTGLKTYRCEYCGKLFLRKTDLKPHLLVHTGLKAYMCEQCNKSFSQRGALKRHLITHTGIKPYICDHCGKAFTNERNLRKHLFAHTDR